MLLLIYLSHLYVRLRANLRTLKASEARYRAVVDTQTEFIARVTPAGRLSFVSDAYCRSAAAAKSYSAAASTNSLSLCLRIASATRPVSPR